MEKTKPGEGVGVPGERRAITILSRMVRAGLTEQRCEGGEPTGYLGRAFQAVGSQCKGPEARACLCMFASQPTTQTWTLMHTNAH